MEGYPLVDRGRFEKSMGPFHEGVVDCGHFEKFMGPYYEGVVDCGPLKMTEPFTRGGVVQSDSNIKAPATRSAPELVLHRACPGVAF